MEFKEKELQDEAADFADRYYPLDYNNQDAATYERQLVAWQACYFGYTAATIKAKTMENPRSLLGDE